MNIFVSDLRPITAVIWNLFLAVIPVVLAFWIARRLRNGDTRRGHAWPLTGAGLLLWLGFLPNACYLLTEWRHYLARVCSGVAYPSAPYSHEMVLRLLVVTGFYIFYSGCGLMAFFLSIWPLDKVIRDRSVRRARALRLTIFALCGLGVYLGLVHRYNTWDLLKPAGLANIMATAVHAALHPFVLVLMIAFSAVLGLLYLAFDIWMDGLRMRMDRR